MKTTFTIANIHAEELEQAIDLHEIEGLTSISEGEFNTRFTFDNLTDEEEAEIHKLIDNIESR